MKKTIAIEQLKKKEIVKDVISNRVNTSIEKQKI